MILMPYLNGIMRARFPVGVTLLVLVNAFVFFGLQSQDEQRYAAAMSYYAKSSLPEIELPRYEAHLRQKWQAQEADAIHRLVEAEETVPALMLMEKDEAFMKLLHDGEVITAKLPEYAAWKETRRQYETEVAAIFSNKFHFDTQKPTWLTALTHQFLHGDTGHLMGNMVVLILIAPAVEALIGTVPFLGIYLLSGFAAVGMHWVLNMNAAGGLVGASGAISGAMGAFAVLLGRRRIPFFYSIVVYFDVIRAPALLALPIWMANEVLQLAWLGNSHVAYGAHLGGLMMGALLAWPLRNKARQLLDVVAAQAESESVTEFGTPNSHLAKARRLMAKQDYDNARTAYGLAAEQANGDEEILRECLNVAHLAPASEAYHLTINNILRLTGNATSTQALVLESFQTYLKKALPVPRIRVSTLIVLVERFARHRNMPELERCVRLLHATASTDPRSAAAAALAISSMQEAGERGRAAQLGELFPSV